MELKELRISKEITQIEASELVGVPLRTYKRIENERGYCDSFKYRQIYKIISSLPIKQEKKQKPLDIVVVGLGYVGLSLSILLSLNNNVTAVDINENKIDLVNQRKPLFSDSLINSYLKKDLHLTARKLNEDVYKNKDVVVIATNTDFDVQTNQFDTSSVDSTIKMVRSINQKALIVIKSTVPIGFTESFKDENIIFSPEFLREGRAIYDNLYPSRIIIGGDKNNRKVKKFTNCLTSISKSVKKAIFMTSKEAEATKLFANAYLAMRVAYFNELDTYAETNKIDTSKIIKGISTDPRIGEYYNNPSFGYGGYCLPKDTAQLKNSVLNIENNNLIEAIVASNITRKEYIVKQIASKVKKGGTIGVYRLTMKSGSDNYRNASILDIIDSLRKKGYQILIYEPHYNGDEKVKDLNELFVKSDLIISNRMSDELLPVSNKVYTRDLYNKD